MVHQPELCAEVTCLPVDRLGVDGAVIFADIMLPLEGMGVDFELREGSGPVLAEPIRSRAAVERLRRVPAELATPYLFEAIRGARSQLGERAALIGFAAAPFTLACYLVEGAGSRDYPHLRALMQSDPALFERLMTLLTEVVTDYLLAQAEAGAQLVQVFDSWVGVLAAGPFREQVAPHLRRLFSALEGTVPAIYFSTSSSHLLEEIAALGAPGVGVDWRVSLAEAWDRVGPDRFLQGNLDPATVLAPWSVLGAAAGSVLSQARGRPGHIFNLGHGILPATEPDQLRRLVELVHDFQVAAAPGSGDAPKG